MIKEKIKRAERINNPGVSEFSKKITIIGFQLDSFKLLR